MSDPIELSSDSSDTIIMSPNANLLQENDNDSDSDIEALVKRYISESAVDTRDKNTTKDTFTHQGTSNEKLDLDIPLVKRSKHSDDDQLKKSFSSSSSSQEGSVDENEALQMLNEKYKRNKEAKEDIHSTNGVISKKLDKESQKQRKMEEKRQKREELEREKGLKQALAAASKPIKAADLKKFVTVGIDNNITNEKYSNEIVNGLQELDVQYQFKSQIFPHTITWSRKTQSHSLGEDGNLVLTSEEQDEDQLLLILDCKEFLQHINNNTLCGHIESMKSILTNKKITLIIYGLQSYTRFLKNQHKNEMRKQITGDSEQPTTSKTFFQDFPKVTNKMIDYGLTELQLLCSCSHRLIDTASDLGLLVAQFTKAVAEIPFKQQRNEKFQQTDWFAAGDNRDCVKVDANGNGLNRLWNQVLTTFPLARLETAEAISAKYPTVSALMTAYENCHTTKEAESLLQDIPVRRAAGPLSTSRKIGPELSKKIHNFFTSTDGDRLL